MKAAKPKNYPKKIRTNSPDHRWTTYRCSSVNAVVFGNRGNDDATDEVEQGDQGTEHQFLGSDEKESVSIVFEEDLQSQANGLEGKALDNSALPRVKWEQWRWWQMPRQRWKNLDDQHNLQTLELQHPISRQQHRKPRMNHEISACWDEWLDFTNSISFSMPGTVRR